MDRAHPGSALWKLLCYHQTQVDWVGCSLHDLIQPSFSFLVGVALPFSLASRLRRGEPALKPRDRRWFDGTVLSEQAFLLRYYGPTDRDDRLLLVNLGADERLCPLLEPLLAPPQGTRWAIRWSSEEIVYGGSGTPALVMHENWKLLGEAALWLIPEERANG